MSISPQLIKSLRDETGAGFMDCKSALEQAGGDIEKARLILREKGAIIASKRASKEVNQGVIAGALSEDGRTGALIDLRCETDFVARNEEFQSLASELLQHVLAVGEEGKMDAILQRTSLSDSSTTVEKQIEIAIGKTGERIAFQGYAIARVPDGENGVVDIYIHHNKLVGVMVVLTGSADKETMQNLAHEIAIQIAWSAPQYLSKDEIPAEALQQELEIENQKVALLEQPFYKDESKTIGDMLKAAGSDLKVVRFVRMEVGAS